MKCKCGTRWGSQESGLISGDCPQCNALLQKKNLRDEFAMAVLQGGLLYPASPRSELAKVAYEVADAMMKEREARP